MSTHTITFQDVVADNSSTLNYLLDQDITTLTPAEFIEELEDAGQEFYNSLSSGLQPNGEAMLAAAAYLTDALTLADDDPEKAALLRRANLRLQDTDI